MVWIFSALKSWNWGEHAYAQNKNSNFTATEGQLTVLLQGFAGYVQVGGAKRIPDEPPPPPEVVLPVVQTPKVQGLTEGWDK